MKIETNFEPKKTNKNVNKGQRRVIHALKNNCP